MLHEGELRKGSVNSGERSAEAPHRGESKNPEQEGENEDSANVGNAEKSSGTSEEDEERDMFKGGSTFAIIFYTGAVEQSVRITKRRWKGYDGRTGERDEGRGRRRHDGGLEWYLC